MNKEQILKKIKSYKLDKKEFIIITGAALVILGIKKSTKDIDISVSDKLYKKLLEEYKCTFEKKANNYDIWYIDQIINFSNNYYNTIKYIEYDGYKVQTPDSILEIKKKLNRSKDIQDIKKITNYIKNKSTSQN